MSNNESEVDLDLSVEDERIKEQDMKDFESEDKSKSDPVEEGKKKAKEVLNSQHEETESARATSAIETTRKNLETMSQQYQTAQQNETSLRTRIEGMEHTIERIDDAGSDDLVLQSLEGGIVMQIESDEIPQVRNDLVESTEELSQQLVELSDSLNKIEHELKKNQAVIQYLENYKDMVAE